MKPLLAKADDIRQTRGLGSEVRMSGMASLSLLLLWFGTTPVPHDGSGLSVEPSGDASTVTIEENDGGAVIVFAHRVQEIFDDGAMVRIEGDCSSACALITALPKERVCVGAYGTIRVHQASFTGGRKDSRLTRLMWDVYPEWVQDLVGDPDQLKTSFVDIDQDTLLEHYDPCNE